MLAAGIPAYRLPREPLNWDIDQIRAMGVKIHLNTAIGKDLSLIHILKSNMNMSGIIAVGLLIPKECLKS